jgi:CheY-like chemotaxis protein
VLDHEIELRSVVGRGSRFSVEVPISSAAAAVQSRRGINGLERSKLTGTVVLCIDNEPKVLDGMEALLGGWGCKVLKAHDLSAATDAIEQAQAPDGLLVDYHLDRGNGIQAIVELRQRLGANLPAILITADRSPQVREQARTHDVRLLNKPLKPAQLRALMGQWRVQRVAAE